MKRPMFNFTHCVNCSAEFPNTLDFRVKKQMYGDQINFGNLSAMHLQIMDAVLHFRDVIRKVDENVEQDLFGMAQVNFSDIKFSDLHFLFREFDNLIYLFLCRSGDTIRALEEIAKGKFPISSIDGKDYKTWREATLIPEFFGIEDYLNYKDD